MYSSSLNKGLLTPWTNQSMRASLFPHPPTRAIGAVDMFDILAHAIVSLVQVPSGVEVYEILVEDATARRCRETAPKRRHRSVPHFSEHKHPTMTHTSKRCRIPCTVSIVLYYELWSLCPPTFMTCLKKNQTTPRPSEHPPVMGEKMSKRLGVTNPNVLTQNVPSPLPNGRRRCPED